MTLPPGSIPYEQLKASLDKFEHPTDAKLSPKIFPAYRYRPNKREWKLWYAQARRMECIGFPSGGLVRADGAFKGSVRLAVHIQRVLQGETVATW